MWSLGFSDKSEGSVAALRATQARPFRWQRLMAEKLRRPRRTGWWLWDERTAGLLGARSSSVLHPPSR